MAIFPAHRAFVMSVRFRQRKTSGAWIILPADMLAVKHTLQHGFGLSIEALRNICPGHDSVEAMNPE
jgi:hypothetical protein